MKSKLKEMSREDLKSYTEDLQSWNDNASRFRIWIFLSLLFPLAMLVYGIKEQSAWMACLSIPVAFIIGVGVWGGIARRYGDQCTWCKRELSTYKSVDQKGWSDGTIYVCHPCEKYYVIINEGTDF